MQSDVQIVITVNGPGEVSCWLYPLGTALRRRLPHARICVAVVPCKFSTGRELDVIASLPFVDAVCSVRDTTSLIFANRLPAGFQRGGNGAVVHLGGDKMLSGAVAQRLKLPCLVYAESRFLFSSLFRSVYYSGLTPIEKRMPAEQAAILGELMVDAAWMRCPVRDPARSGRLAIGIYPGSRAYIVKYMLPFFAKVASLVSESMPDIDFMLAKADYLPTEFLSNLPDVDDGRPLAGDKLIFSDTGGRPALVTPNGMRIGIHAPAEVAAKANVALTVPGSNTGEMAALGVPMVVALPTYWGAAEKSPLPGLAGHIDRVPIVGRYVRSAMGYFYLRSLGQTSHPNRRAGRTVIPEIVGKIDARQVAEAVLSILQSDTRPLEAELRSSMGRPGAAERLIDGLMSIIQPDAVRS